MKKLLPIFLACYLLGLAGGLAVIRLLGL